MTEWSYKNIWYFALLTHLMSIQLETVDWIALTNLNQGNNKQIVIGHVYITYPFLIIEVNYKSHLL